MNGKQLAPRRRSSPVLRQVAWASIPIWSIGFLSFVPFLGFAVINRRRRDWVVFGVYLAATIAMIVSLGAVNSSSGAGAAVGGFIVALAGCAAVHTAVLFRPGREQAAVPAGAPTGAAAGALAEPASLEQANREAVARAKSRLERRKEARRMVAAQPDLARDLKIGRPDLPRDYDDGGLVDVNHVPSAVLSAQLGLTPAEVTDVLTARTNWSTPSSSRSSAP